MTSSLSANEGHREGTTVKLRCSFDAHPASQLSLLSNDRGTVEHLSQDRDTFLEVAITLTKEMNGRRFYCQAESPSEGYLFVSEEISYMVECKYT